MISFPSGGVCLYLSHSRYKTNFASTITIANISSHTTCKPHVQKPRLPGGEQTQIDDQTDIYERVALPRFKTEKFLLLCTFTINQFLRTEAVGWGGNKNFHAGNSTRSADVTLLMMVET